MRNLNEFIDACEKYHKGNYVVTQWNVNKRCIIKLNHFGYDGLETLIFADYGLNSINQLLLNQSFGLNNNFIRLATQEEIDYLEREYHKHKAKVQMEQEKNITCDSTKNEIKITCGDVEIVINKK